MKARQTLSNRLLSFFGLSEDASISPDASTVILGDANGQGSFRLPAAVSDRYQVRSILGKGAFGVVFLARDVRIGRLIAVKQLYRKYRRSEGIYTRFLQEARIAGQLDHPNIVTIYDVTGHDEAACIVMEYLGGGNLATVLEDEGVLSETQALIVMRGILNGLAAAHRMRVVHRDIKPRNILFDLQRRPKIGDFGVAHLPPEAGGLPGIDDSPAGTPEYMAPEQWLPGTTVDSRADLFSAGVMFLEMLTGRRVYNLGGEQGVEAIAATICTTPMPDVRRLLPGAAPVVAEVLQGLLQRDPERRLQTAEEALTMVDEELVARGSGGADAPVTEATRSGGAPGQNEDMFEDILRLFLVDGVVSPPERRELTRRAKRLGIPYSLAVRLEEGVREEMGLPSLSDLGRFEDKVESLLRDGDFSAADRQAMAEQARRCGISEEEHRRIVDRVLLKLHMTE